MRFTSVCSKLANIPLTQSKARLENIWIMKDKVSNLIHSVTSVILSCSIKYFKKTKKQIQKWSLFAGPALSGTIVEHVGFHWWVQLCCSTLYSSLITHTHTHARTHARIPGTAPAHSHTNQIRQWDILRNKLERVDSLLGEESRFK